jgi:hypothetical protein
MLDSSCFCDFVLCASCACSALRTALPKRSPGCAQNLGGGMPLVHVVTYVATRAASTHFHPYPSVAHAVSKAGPHRRGRRFPPKLTWRHCKTSCTKEPLDRLRLLWALTAPLTMAMVILAGKRVRGFPSEKATLCAQYLWCGRLSGLHLVATSIAGHAECISALLHFGCATCCACAMHALAKKGVGRFW